MNFAAGRGLRARTCGGKPRGEVMGRTLGIIGYGRIGREVASRAAGLKCRILLSPTAARSLMRGRPDGIHLLAELDRDAARV